MPGRARVLSLGLVALTFLFSTTAFAKASRPERLSISTVEGVVAKVEEHEGESGLATLALVLEISGSERRQTVLLAPASACREIGFEVEEGDRIRVRIFVGDDDPDRAHKALNLTRGTMVRFRTLRSVPLWTSTGAWLGGARRVRQGSAAGGSTSRRPGPGPGRP